MDLRARIETAVGYIRERTSMEPEVGMVLGSGLGPLARAVEEAVDIPTREIPDYPPSTVEGHEGLMRLGRLAGRRVVILKGRVHGYEGYDLERVTMPIRIMARLGIDVLILTNAAGGINREFAPGDTMLITDHLNLQGASPLRGPNVDEWGPRFPDMTEVYDTELRKLALKVAATAEFDLQRGVYASCAGPQYETPAEVRMLATLGADAVGMSTVPEAIVARHMGLRVLGFSVVSNAAAGISQGELTHDEVVEAGRKVGPALSSYLGTLLAALGDLEP